jgi:prohibitin 2
MPQIPLRAILAGALGLGALGGVGYVATHSLFSVAGGQKAIMFNRIGGVDSRVYECVRRGGAARRGRRRGR